MKDLLAGDIPHEMQQQILCPINQEKRNILTKEYMADFFKRNLTRPTQELELPPYLQPFKFKEPDTGTEEMLEKLKTGEYDIKHEER